MNDKNSLSHTTYRCKDHVVILPKYRRMIIYNKLRADIGQILRQLIERKPDCELLEAEACENVGAVRLHWKKGLRNIMLLQGFRYR